MSHPADRYFERDGVVLRYRLTGAGPGVTLNHGVGADLESWDGVAERLEDRFTLLRYDMRGHGESTKVRGTHTIDGFVADYAALLDHLGIARNHFVGFSLGGIVAQAVALGIPERVEKLVILASVAGRTPAERKTVWERADGLAAGNLANHARKAAAERWFTPEFQADHADIVAAQIARSQAMDPESYAAAYRVFAANDFADRLPEIRHRTLIAAGECDPTGTERMARLMAARIPDSTMHIFPRMRHGLLAEAPGQVADLLAAFLAGRPPG